jgi:acetoin utilization protein AcuB
MKLSAPISELMTKNVVCVSPNQKIIDLKHIYEKQEFHHHIPVTQNDKLVGMVSLIDFMRAIHNATLDDTEVVYHALYVKDIMTENPVSIPENTPIKEVAEILAKGQFHSVVITENKAVKGIVTTVDLLRFLLSGN